MDLLKRNVAAADAACAGLLKKAAAAEAEAQQRLGQLDAHREQALAFRESALQRLDRAEQERAALLLRLQVRQREQQCGRRRWRLCVRVCVGGGRGMPVPACARVSGRGGAGAQAQEGISELRPECLEHTCPLTPTHPPAPHPPPPSPSALTQALDSKVDAGPPGLWRMSAQVQAQGDELAEAKAAQQAAQVGARRHRGWHRG